MQEGRHNRKAGWCRQAQWSGQDLGSPERVRSPWMGAMLLSLLSWVSGCRFSLGGSEGPPYLNLYYKENDQNKDVGHKICESSQPGNWPHSAELGLRHSGREFPGKNDVTERTRALPSALVTRGHVALATRGGVGKSLSSPSGSDLQGQICSHVAWCGLGVGRVDRLRLLLF